MKRGAFAAPGSISASSRAERTFARAVEALLKREGGYVDHPSDPGGATNYGISTRWLRSIGDQRDVGQLRREDAVKLYRKHFWDRYGFSSWIQERLAIKVFDATVNMGPARAMRCFQRALRSCGRPVLEDGVYGAVTERAKNDVCQDLGEDALMTAYRSELAGHYRLLASEDSERSVFLRGWLKRAYDEEA